jgi:hypothetical protein
METKYKVPSEARRNIGVSSSPINPFTNAEGSKGVLKSQSVTKAGKMRSNASNNGRNQSQDRVKTSDGSRAVLRNSSQGAARSAAPQAKGYQGKTESHQVSRVPIMNGDVQTDLYQCPSLGSASQDPGAININVPAKFKEDELEDDQLTGEKTPNTLLKKCTFALEEETVEPPERSRKKREFRPRNLFNPDDDYFYKGDKKPSLFDVAVDG